MGRNPSSSVGHHGETGIPPVEQHKAFIHGNDAGRGFVQPLTGKPKKQGRRDVSGVNQRMTSSSRAMARVRSR
jgi:hypothetical protein